MKQYRCKGFRTKTLSRRLAASAACSRGREHGSHGPHGGHRTPAGHKTAYRRGREAARAKSRAAETTPTESSCAHVVAREPTHQVIQLSSTPTSHFHLTYLGDVTTFKGDFNLDGLDVYTNCYNIYP